MKKHIHTLFAAGLLLLALPLSVSAQEAAEMPAAGDSVAAQRPAGKIDHRINITGTVTDASTGKPIEGATISMKEISVYTKEDGTFSLKSEHPFAVMTVSAPGFETRGVEWRGRLNLTVRLTPDNFSTALTARLKNPPRNESLIPATAAVQSIEDIDLTLPQQGFDHLLQERLGTVQVTHRSGSALLGSQISVRGVNTLNADAQPLVLVDGIPLESYQDVESLHSGFFLNGWANIDVRDVENITVIKDAVSIYGAKASNGVILIETVRGHDPVTRITANVDFGFTQQPKTLPMLDADQSRVLMSELYRDYTLLESDEVDELMIFNDRQTGNIHYNATHNRTDWKEWVYNPVGINQGYSARATGGDAVGMYALSVGYVGNEGTVKGTSMNHLNFRFNSEIKIVETLKTDIDFSISSLSYSPRNEGVTSKTSPSYLADVKAPFFYPYTFSALTNLPTTEVDEADALGTNNPVAILDAAEQMSKQTNFVAALRPMWNITKELRLQAVASYGMDKLYESYFTPMAGVAPEYVKTTMGYTQVYENEAKAQTLRDTRLDLEAKLAYDKDFGNHRLGALLGWRYLLEDRLWDFTQGYNTGQDNQVDVSNSLQYKVLDGEDRKVRNMSWYLTLGWNYRQKYFLNAAASMETSSRFGTEVQGALDFCGQSWGIFPSVQAAWAISSEDFMAGAGWIDLLKLRASYGLTGNDGIKDYITYSYFESKNYMSQASGLVLGNLGNPSVKWETTAKADIGLDMSFFHEHLSATLDFYQNKTSDLLVQKQLRRLAGFETSWTNDGELSNKGIEFSFNARLIDVNRFRWELSGAIAHNVNRVERLSEGDYLTSVYDAEILTAVGQPIASFYGYKYLGVYSTTAQASTAYKGSDYIYRLNDDTSLSPYQAGDAIYEDVNGDGIISEDDKQILGSAAPDFTGMLSTTLAYKGVSLSAVFNYSVGNEMYNYQRRVYESMSTFNNQTTAVLNRWRAEGNVTDVPQASYGDPMGNADFSSRWVEDASFIRLKSLTLRWDLPYDIKVLKDASVFATCYNPFVWTRYLGCDPETSVSTNVFYQGIDTGLMPQSRSFVFGVRLKL